MAVAGDAYVALSAAVANNSFLDIQPAGTLEIVLHSIFYEGPVEFEWYDGTNIIKFDSDATATGGSRENLVIHCTNSMRVRVKNVAGSSKDIGATGFYTRT